MEIKFSEIRECSAAYAAACYAELAMEAVEKSQEAFEDYATLKKKYTEDHPHLRRYAAEGQFGALEVAKDCISTERLYRNRAQMFAALATMQYLRAAQQRKDSEPPF